MASSFNNGWTGGQYSLFRALFGAYLVVHFANLAPWAVEVFSHAGMLPNPKLSPLWRAFPSILTVVDHGAFVTAFVASGAVAAVAFALGYRDRLAALWCWYVLACLFVRNPLIQNPSLPYTGWMLLLHVALPPAPYGSLAARGRADPTGRWSFPHQLFFAAWVVLALSYSYSGWTKLSSPSWISGDTVSAVLRNPLARDSVLREAVLAMPDVLLRGITWFILVIELMFVPLALIPRARPWIWGGMLLVQIGFAALLRFPDLTIAMLLFHMLTLDPGWVKARPLRGVRVYYDGVCTLCHASVRFLLAEERQGELRFSPLQSPQGQVIAAARGDQPDSVIVQTADGLLLAEDDAVLFLMTAIGGYWRLIAQLFKRVPKALRRRAYHAVGTRRYRWFGKKPDQCPLVPPHIRVRFDVT